MLNAALSQERALMRRWVETWRVAGAKLEKLRQRELEATDTRAAVRQIFSTAAPRTRHPSSSTSGLVEQQVYFARLRR